MVSRISDDGQERDLLGPAIDTLPITFAILDDAGTILATNRAWREYANMDEFSTCPGSVGVNYLDLLDRADSEHAGQAAVGLRQVLNGERTQFVLDYPCTESNTQRWFTLQAGSFTSEGATYVAVAHIDITDRKQRERALSKSYGICTDTSRSFSEQLDAILDVGREVLGTDYATLSQIHGDEYVFEAVKTPPGDDLDAGETVSIDELPNCRHVVRSETSLVHEDVESQAPEFADSEWGISNYIGAPVMVDEEVYGTFCFYGMEPRATDYTQWDRTFVEILAGWAGYELERMRHVKQIHALETAFPDPSFIIDAEGRYLECLTTSESMDLVVAEPDELVGNTIHELLPESTADSLLATVRAAIETGEFQSVEYKLEVPAGMRWFEARVAPLPAGDYDLDSVIFIARDITAHKERQQELERQRDELAQLQRLNRLSREITKALQGTTTRSVIESAVCRHLTQSDLYRAVWVGTRENTSSVEPVAAAGVDESALDSVSAAERELAADAIQEGEVLVVEDITTVPTPSTAGLDSPLVHDHSSLAAVPLSTGETTYGVLVVYEPVGDSIGWRERDILADLGQIIALSIQRVHSQRSLKSATAVELEFKLPDSDIVFAAISERLDCEFSLERQVPKSDGTRLHYVRVDETTVTTACELLCDSPAVESCTVVREGADGRTPLLEVSLGEISMYPLEVLADYGGSVTRATAKQGDIFITTELAPDIDVRSVVEAIRETDPDTELLSKQYLDEPVTTVSKIQQQVRDQLTPKQEAALRAAYARGYYSWPRGSTAEELAETLDVSAPTLHYRLRRAHQTVMTALFDDGTAFEESS